MKTTYQSALDYLWSVVEEEQDPKIQALLSGVLKSKAFLEAPASGNKHHAYKGGLVMHTAEVVWLAEGFAETCGATLDIVLPAAFLHDAAKLYENPVSGGQAPYRHLIRHVAGSVMMAAAVVGDAWITDERYRQITHAMLAHHGRKEFGSPIEPQTPEAFCVHWADMMSLMQGQAHTADQFPLLDLYLEPKEASK